VNHGQTALILGGAGDFCKGESTASDKLLVCNVDGNAMYFRKVCQKSVWKEQKVVWKVEEQKRLEKYFCVPTTRD